MRRSLGAWLGCVLALSSASIASAHLGHLILRAERYLKLDASDHELRVVVSLTLGPQEAGRVLRAADANGDATVTQAEADAYLAQWIDGLRTQLPITVDGARAEASWSGAVLDPIGRIEAQALTAEVVGHVPLEGGPHRIELVDGMESQKFDRTDVAFHVRDGARLVASGEGRSPDAPLDALTYGASDQQRVLTMRVALPGEPPSRGWPAVLAVVLVLAGAALAVWRARRAR